MQYIQLQGQIASQLDLPLDGSYNLFIDTSDNSIKVKDGDGHIHGGLSGLTELTYNQLTASIASGSLTPGSFYKVTNAGSSSNDSWATFQEGGSTIILQASTTGSISKRGIGLFYNPNYNSASVWDNTFVLQMESSMYNADTFFNMGEYILCDGTSDVVLRPNVVDSSAIVVVDNHQSASFFANLENYPIAFTSDNTGITGSFVGVFASASYAVGDKAIWGGRVWENLSGSIGWEDGSYDLNTEDWAKVPFASSSYYTLVADEIEFDIENNYIQYRKDIKNNIEIIQTYDADEGRIVEFPWGHPNIRNVSLENTSTNGFVNFHNSNSINGLYMKHGSRFEANYWGKINQFSDIYGDVDSDISQLALGHGCDIRRIRLGIDSRIGSGGTIFIAGNDGDNAFYDITLDNNSRIFDIELYQYSSMHDLTIGMNSQIYGMNIYNDADVYSCNLEMNSNIANISMGRNSSIYNIELESDSYIDSFNMDYNSSLYNIRLGGSSYLEYSSIGISCEMSEIDLGLDCGSYCNTLNGVNGTGSSISEISLRSNSSFNNIVLHPATYIQNITGTDNVGFGNITITGSNSNISNFEIELGGGFGSFTIDGTAESTYLSDFKIGQNEGFGGIGTYTTSYESITLDRGFRNFLNTATQSLDNEVGPTDNPLITFYNRSIITLDISGATTYIGYELPDGQYEGQELTFVAKSDGTHSITSDQINIWTNKLVTSGNGYGLDDRTGSTHAFRPFARWNGSYWDWRNVTKAIWTGGVWVTDAEAFND
jgi:hypothetical protein